MEHTIVKSSWNKFIEQLKIGVAFRGSVFNKELDELYPTIEIMLKDEFYNDRSYKDGVSSICLNVLAPNGDAVGTSYIAKQGKVYLIDNKFFMIEHDTNKIFYQFNQKDVK